MSEGYQASFALGADGKIYAWGTNDNGQLGDGSTTDSSVPVQVSLPGGVAAVAISAGEQSSLALGSDGNVYGWGGNSPVPVQVPLPGGVTATAISLGDQTSLALGSNGNVYAWGSNEYGQVGNGTSGNSVSTPVQVPLPAGVSATAISEGEQTSTVLGSDGNVYAWGYNYGGQLGNGSTTNSDVPVAVSLPGGVRATAVSEGFDSTLALGADGNVYAWGGNWDAQLGDGSFDDSLTPVQVALPSGSTATAISGDWNDGSAFAIVGGTPAVAPPAFSSASPPLQALPGTAYSAIFPASGSPTYTLTGAPSSLQITPTGAVTGTPPAGTTSFSYSVSASNPAGTVVDGPFTVNVQAVAQITGTLQDSAGSPVSQAVVQDCIAVSGNDCSNAAPDSSGSFTLAAPIGQQVVITAFADPGSGLVATSTLPLSITAAGISNETITMNGLTPLPAGLALSGTVGPSTVFWASPAQVTTTGCANGVAGVTVTGQDETTGQPSTSIALLAESPVGSGVYAGTIPPEEPVHGPADLESLVTCLPQSALSPGSGPVTAGTPVTISGSGLSGATAVTFGSVPAESFTVLGDQVVQAVAPPGSGTVTVTVTTGSSSVIAGQYTYMEVLAVTPPSGPAGTTVDITGTGLGQATEVDFGGVPADFTQVSPNEIEAVVPQGTGTEDVTVTTQYGPAPTSPAVDDEFTYGPPLEPPPPPPTPPVTPPPPAGEQDQADSIPSQVAQEIANQAEDSVVPGLSAIMTLIKGLKHPSCSSSLTALAQGLGANPAVADATESLSKSFGAEVWSLVQQNVSSVRSIVTAEAAAAEAGDVAATVALAGELATFAAITDIAAAAVVAAMVGMLLEAFVKHYLGCPGGTTNLLIDPSGAVLDTHGNPVAGASVSILGSDTAAGPFTAVDTSSPGIEPAVNPEVTGSDGAFHWDVDAGWYEVSASAAGCTDPSDPASPTATIGPYPVPPPQTGLTVTLACAGEQSPPVPSVQNLSTNTGPPGGGTTVTVTGSGFTPSSTVTFAGTAATSVTYLSPEALSVVSPPGSGLADVVVQNAGATSATTAADQFLYGSAPVVTGLSQVSGPVTGGTVTTISGTGFTKAAGVSFGGLPVTSFTVESDTQIEATAPPQAAGTVDVQVMTPAGTSQQASADQFTYLPAATTTTLTSSANPALFGNSLTYTATVAPVTTPSPTGTVTFYQGLQPIGTATLSNGSASLTTTAPDAGSYNITATYSGDANFTASTSKVVQQTVGQQPQTIKLTAPATGVVGGSATLSATGGPSGSPVVFTLDPGTAAGVCSLSGPDGSTLTYLGVGSCIIDANQAGDNDYAPADQVTATIIVSAAKITVTVSGTQSYGSSAPAFNYTSNAPVGVTVTGTLTCTSVTSPAAIGPKLGAGSYTIDGSSCRGLTPSTADYALTYAGMPGGFVVSPAGQAVSFTTTPPNPALVGGPAYTPAATASSGLPVTITVDTSSPTVCSISSSGQVTFQAAGTCVLDALQDGNANFYPAEQAQQSITVDQAPAFALDTPPTAAYTSQAYSYVFAANGSPAPSYALAGGAPKWLTIGATTGLVTGIPPVGTKSFSYTVIASNSVGQAIAGPFQVAVSAAQPSRADVSVSISCPKSASVGATVTCTVTAANAGPATAQKVSVAAIAASPDLGRLTVADGGTAIGHLAVWHLAALSPGTSAKLSFTASAVHAGTATIIALAVFAGIDPNPFNNLTATTITIPEPTKNAHPLRI